MSRVQALKEANARKCAIPLATETPSVPGSEHAKPKRKLKRGKPQPARKTTPKPKHDLQSRVESMRDSDLEAADSVLAHLKQLLSREPVEAKELKELMGILHQLSGTRKNILSYGNGLPEGNTGDWTTHLEIVGLNPKAIL